MKDVDYSQGVGFGTLTLTVDGQAASIDKKFQTSQGAAQDTNTNGSITVKVSDLSPSGQTSMFEIDFQLIEGSDVGIAPKHAQQMPSAMTAEQIAAF